jgi:hypothetical protein
MNEYVYLSRVLELQRRVVTQESLTQGVKTCRSGDHRHDEIAWNASQSLI